MSAREHGTPLGPEVRADDEAASSDEQRPLVTEQEQEAARRARFLEALDHAMAKHHNVFSLGEMIPGQVGLDFERRSLPAA